jgi:uncharacterized protein YutE (UPF0331/DUF86 family)
LLELDDDKVLNYLLKNLANATKAEKFRKYCTNSEIIKKIINILSEKSTNLKRDASSLSVASQLPVILQAIRSIGNILYSNEPARTIVYDYDAGKTFVSLFDLLNTEIIESNYQLNLLYLRGC